MHIASMRWITALPLCLIEVFALTSAEWRSHSIYQVVTDRFARTDGSTTQPCQLSTYCGGTWQGLINKLDYIQGMGFTAVWISPIVKNIDVETSYGWAYHGYWPQDIFALNAKFGTPGDLKALSWALHVRGMSLMVDVVTNHMAYPSAPDAVDYTTLIPFNSEVYYHPYCPIDYSNATSIQQCWVGDTVVSLPDLRTEDLIVQNTFNAWVANLVAEYGIDGLRIDSAQQVGMQFFPTFISSSNVFAMGEVLNGDPSYLCNWQSVIPGVLNYAAYFWIKRAFTSTDSSMTELANGIQMLGTVCPDVTLLGNFIENHDNPRFPSLTGDTSLIRNAIAYSLLSDGIPIVYYGQEQGMTGIADPDNRQALWTTAYDTSAPLYTYIARLNLLRKTAIQMDPFYTTSVSSIAQSDARTLVTTKGVGGSKTFSVFTNIGIGSNTIIVLESNVTAFVAQEKVVDLMSCTIFIADSAGNLPILISDGLPLVLYGVDGPMAEVFCENAVENDSNSSPNVGVPTTSNPDPLKSDTPSVVSEQASELPLASSDAADNLNSLELQAAPSTPTLAPTDSTICPASNNTVYTRNSLSFFVECGIDHAGGDLEMQWSNDLGSCIDLCATTTGCVGVSFLLGACYMKSTLGDGVYNQVNGARMIGLPAQDTAQNFVLEVDLWTASPVPASSEAPTPRGILPLFTTSDCILSPTVSLAFNQNVMTKSGEIVKLVGSIPQLGAWNTDKAIVLSTEDNLTWSTGVTIGAGTDFEYKLIRVQSDKTIIWEDDPVRRLTVPVSCAVTAFVNGTWHGLI